MRLSRAELFRGRHFCDEVIALCVPSRTGWLRRTLPEDDQSSHLFALFVLPEPQDEGFVIRVPLGASTAPLRYIASLAEAPEQTVSSSLSVPELVHRFYGARFKQFDQLF